MSDFLAHIVADLDVDGAQKQFDSFKKKNKELKVNLVLDGLNGSLAQRIKQQFYSQGKQAGASLNQGLESELGKMKLDTAKEQLKVLKDSLKNMNFNGTAIKQTIRNLKELDVSITRVSHRFNSKTLSVKVDGVDKLGRMVSQMAYFDNQTGELKNKTSQVVSEAKKMFESMDVDKVNSSLDVLNTKFIKLKGSTTSYTKQISELKNRLLNVYSIKGLSNQQSEFESIKQGLLGLQNSYKSAKAESDRLFNSQKLVTQKNILNNQIVTWMDKNASATKVYRKELETIQISLKKVNTMSKLTNIGKQFTSIKTQAQAEGLTGKTTFQILKDNVANTTSSLDILNTKFAKLKGTTGEYSKQIADLKDRLANIFSIKGLSNQQAEFESIKQGLFGLQNSYKSAKAESDRLLESQKLMTRKDILSNQITTWMNKNTKATKIYGKELETIKKSIKEINNMSELRNVSQQFSAIKAQSQAEGLTGRTLFQTLKDNVTKVSPMFGMGMIMSTTIRGIRDMLNKVVTLDTALVDLQKTTSMNTSELEAFYKSSNKIAIQMGVTTEEILNQASAWSRLGYSSKKEVESMSKLSSQFAKISPGMSVDEATDGLVSTMKAFGIEVDDVLDGIMSKVNIIGNTKATSNSEIVTMLSRSSSAMAEANNTLEQTIALETAAVEITRDAASVGTAFKTISMRIRGKHINSLHTWKVCMQSSSINNTLRIAI